MKSENSAHRAAFSILGDAIESGWRLLADTSLFTAPLREFANAATGEATPEKLVEQLRAAFDEALERAREQPTPLTSLLELLTAAAKQLQILQASMTDGTLSPLPFSLPPLGPAQAQQQRLQAAAAALQEFSLAQQEHIALLTRLAEQTLAAVGERMQGLPAGTGWRAMHMAALEAAEEAHERFLASDDYARSLGRVTNAGGAVMRACQTVIEDILKHFNLPTREDIESTQRRLHDIRRRQFALAEEFDPDEIRQLKDEVRALRRELDELRVQREPNA